VRRTFEEDAIEWFVNEMVSTAQVCSHSLSCLVWNLPCLQVLLVPFSLICNMYLSRFHSRSSVDNCTSSSLLIYLTTRR